MTNEKFELRLAVLAYNLKTAIFIMNTLIEQVTDDELYNAIKEQEKAEKAEK